MRASISSMRFLKGLISGMPCIDFLEFSINKYWDRYKQIFFIMSKSKHSIHGQNIVACVWDFDKTLIPGYMQEPLFKEYNLDGKAFWNEVNRLPGIYKERGINVSSDTVYLNHLLNYVKNGALKGLTNRKLRELGKELRFYEGLPGFFLELKELVKSKKEYRMHGLTLEHYIISTGLAEMIRGSLIAPYVEDIYGCEFVENPFPPGFLVQPELLEEVESEISQIGVMVDNTIKTRFIFEINKGTNKNASIDVNSKMTAEDRRIPLSNMLYIADGPSDVPVFSVVKDQGGKTFAVYNAEQPEEFKQNDNLLQSGRIHAYGPADYRSSSATSMWLKMHVMEICDRIVKDRSEALESRVSKPPRHLHKEEVKAKEDGLVMEQFELFGE